MQYILYKIYFWKVFHVYYNLICILYALLCGHNFLLVKSGCYTAMPRHPCIRATAGPRWLVRPGPWSTARGLSPRDFLYENNSLFPIYLEIL
jgi:hypothetical protein